MAFPARATNGFYELIDRLDHVYDTNFGKSEISATKEEENYRKMYVHLRKILTNDCGFSTAFFRSFDHYKTVGPHFMRPHKVTFHSNVVFD